MIIFGHYNRDRIEDTGQFQCPQCNATCDFTLIRTWSYFHLYFIPIAKQALVAERIQCGNCYHSFPITVLAGVAAEVTSAFPADNGIAPSISDHFCNVVEFTDSAIEEIRRRHAAGRFGADVVVRVTPDRSEYPKVMIQFDYALADGRDWIGQSHGIPMVVDREYAPELQGSTIDFRDGNFVRT
jgi:Fe-S cluster assembly iron-binding protein IscA